MGFREGGDLWLFTPKPTKKRPSPGPALRGFIWIRIDGRRRKVYIYENEHRKTENDPTHKLWFWVRTKKKAQGDDED